MRLWFERALLADGWADGVRMRIDGGRIAAIEAEVAPNVDDERYGAAIAGLPNVHSHAFQRAMAGLTEVRGPASDNFWTWRAQMYRFLGRLDPEGMRTIAAFAYVEMLESGFTRVGEFHYVHNDTNGAGYAEPAVMAAAIGEAAAETGIALTLLPVFYAHADFGGAPPSEGQRRFISDLDGYARLVEGCRTIADGLEGANVGLAPHSLRAVTPDELAMVVAMAGDAPVHIHAAEQTGEVEACLAWSGRRPVDWLLDHAPVDDRWCLVHATHVTGDEVGRIAASGAVVGLCPITEANLGDGIFPARDLLAVGGRFGVGTDSNVLIDAPQELRMLEYAQRLSLRSRNVMAADEGQSTGAALYAQALAGGSQALGVADAGLRVGASADIVSFAAGTKAALLDSWIFGGREQIDCVWRVGKKMVSEGRHVGRDAIAARYAALMRSLLS